MGWTPISFDNDTNTICICADSCAHDSIGNKQLCNQCKALPYTSKFQDFVQCATDTSECTPWDYLNAQQLQALLKTLSDKCRKL